MSSIARLMNFKMFSRATSPSRDGLWYLVAGFSSLCAFLSSLGLDPESFESAIKALLVTSGALFGFLITSLSILLAISNREFVIKLRASGHFKNLVDQIFFNAAVLVVSLGGGLAYLLTGLAAFGCTVSAATSFSLIIFLRIGWKYRVIFHRL